MLFQQSFLLQMFCNMQVHDEPSELPSRGAFGWRAGHSRQETCAV